MKRLEIRFGGFETEINRKLRPLLPAEEADLKPPIIELKIKCAIEFYIFNLGLLSQRFIFRRPFSSVVVFYSQFKVITVFFLPSS